MPTKRKSIPIDELVHAIDDALISARDAAGVVAFLSGYFGREPDLRAALERVLALDGITLSSCDAVR